MSEQPNTPIDRRDFGRLASGALAAAAAANLSRTTAAAAETPGIKLCVQSPAKPSDEQLLFLKQLGAQHTSAWGRPGPANGRRFHGDQEAIRRCRHHGMEHRQCLGAQHARGHAQPAGPGPEDRGIQAVSAQSETGGDPLQHLRSYGQRDLDQRPHRTCAAPQLASSISTVRTPAATGMARSTPGRSRTAASSTPDEIWENYTYFIKQVAPVAEETGVRIGIHPDDPPVPVLAGVPRCVFSNFAGYKRAMEIADSPNVGICLRCGTWLEGGKKLTGKDPEEMIRHFGARKIWKIHFRNVSHPCRILSRPSWTTAITTCGRS